MKKGERFINFRPLFFIAIALMIGISCGYLFAINSVVTANLVLWGFVLTTLFVLYLLRKNPYYKKFLFLLPFLLVFAIIGGLNTYITIIRYDRVYIPEMEYVVEGKIVQIDTTYRQEEENKTKYVLDDITLIGQPGLYDKYKVSVSVEGQAEYEVGDRIVVKGIIYCQSLYYDSNVNLYGVKDGIKYRMYCQSSDIALAKAGFNVFYKTRLFIENSLNNGLSSDTFGVARGMLLGNTDDVEADTLDTFRYSGVAHIFAVSGLHIGFLAGVLGFIFTKLKAKRYISIPITIMCLFFYSGICGFTVSSLRAAIMFSFLSVSGLFMSKYDGLSSISLANIVVLTLFPLELFSAGFLLSFTVTLFIILLSRPFTNVYNSCLSFIFRRKGELKYNSLQNKFASALAVSTASFIASVPLCMAFFDYISPLSIIVNILFIPVASVVFVALLLCCVFGGIFNASYYFLYPVKWVLWFMNFLFWQLDPSRFTVKIDTFSYFAISYYLALTVVAGLYNFSKRIIPAIAIILLVITFFGVTHLSNLKTNETRVYSLTDAGISCTIYDGPDENVMVINDCSGYLNTGALKRALRDGEILTLDAVVVADNDADIYGCIDKIIKYANIKTVYYHYQSNPVDFANFYKGVEIIACKTDTVISSKNLTINYIRAGYGVEIYYNNHYYLSYGKLPNGDYKYFVLDKDYDHIVSFSFIDEFEKSFNKTVLSYSYNGNFKYNTVANGYVKNIFN